MLRQLSQVTGNGGEGGGVDICFNEGETGTDDREMNEVEVIGLKNESGELTPVVGNEIEAMKYRESF